nr:RNA-dependent RNA polymerase [Monilinia fructicola botourmiavirus 11]
MNMTFKGTERPLVLFPSGNVVFRSFDAVLADFLAFRRKRSRLRRSGCIGAFDVNGEPPRPGNRPSDCRKQSPANASPADACQFSGRLRRKAKTCVRFLSRELGLKRAHALPSRICCSQLRSAVRSCFDDLNEIQELSVKTSCKLETCYCQYCEDTLVPTREKKWKEARFQPQRVDESHLALFVKALERNVDAGWNKGKWPYIPNGHACLGKSRLEGGTWIPGEFSDDCEVVSVVSSGKPRIVTLFSEYNSSVLHSLHHSLYDSLKRKGWLLVGEPTNEKVASLNGGAYISVDYSSATDNIKTEYTRAAIEVLIEKGIGMTNEEIACLRVVGRLRVDGRPAESGQPMGSLMSFPLLCLINKTVVDLSLNEFLIRGEISFKEWTSHRCLINGDDLLLRDLSVPGLLLPVIQVHGSEVGLVVNDDKTMVDARKGEINSTLFVDGIKQKKINCGALFMGRCVEDVVGMAYRSSLSVDGFLYLVKRNLGLLRDAKVKLHSPLPLRHLDALIRDLDIRGALRTIPSEGTEPYNPFPVVPVPDGYDLSREEEIALIESRVLRLRSMDFRPVKKIRQIKNEIARQSLRRATRRKPNTGDMTLAVLAKGWEEKRWESLARKDSPVYIVPYEHVCDHCATRSHIERMICEIRELKRVSWLPVRGCQVPGADPSGWAL